MKINKLRRGIISFVVLLLAIGTVASALIIFHRKSSRAQAATSVTLISDGTQKFQSMNGLGVSVVPFYWKDGALKPALDRLVDELGGNIFRLDVYGQSNWEEPNDNGSPTSFAWNYYNNIYNSQKFQDVWNTARYLNSKGVKVILWAEGQVPDWMGSSVISSTKEDEWVEMIVSMVCYAKAACGSGNTSAIGNFILSPINETDFGGGSEGPSVAPLQFARLINKLSARLNSLGLTDIKIATPDQGFADTTYINELIKDPLVMSKIDDFAFHSYWDAIGNLVSPTIDQYNAKNGTNKGFWMTEWSQMDTDGNLDDGRNVANEWNFAKAMTEYLIDHLKEGASAALAWDGFDSSFDPYEAPTSIVKWGLLTSNYTPKKRFYTNAQFFKFIPADSVRVNSTSSMDDQVYPSFKALTFYHPTSGKVVIAGKNLSASSVVLTGSLKNLPTVPAFEFYKTTSSVNLSRGADITLTNGSFSVLIDPDSFFTLVSATGTGGSSTPSPTSSPVVTPTPSPTNTPTPTPVPTPTPTPTTGGSTIKIFAAGWDGGGTFPNMRLDILNTATNTWTAAATFNGVRGDFSSRTFVQYTYTHTTKVLPNQVRVVFTNDYWGNSFDDDRNLFVDRINIDGLDYQSEAAATFVTGALSSGATNGLQCTSGNLKTERLECNGYFQYQ